MWFLKICSCRNWSGMAWYGSTFLNYCVIWYQSLSFFAGRLYITNVQEKDHEEGKAYVCMAINYFMRRNTYDKANYINPRGSKWPSKAKNELFTSLLLYKYFIICQNCIKALFYWLINFLWQRISIPLNYHIELCHHVKINY